MVIYKITNKINGKIYIGMTKNNPTYRWQQHCAGHYNSLISSAIKKYGKEYFIFEILAKAKTLIDLSNLEKNFIEEYNCLTPNGYNLETGGTRLYEVSEISKRKMSLAASGKIISEETRKKMSIKGKGRKHSEETKKKLSKIQKELAIRKGITPTNARAIFGYNEELGISWFFKSSLEAEKFGFQSSNINKVCRNKLKNHKGFKWKYFDDLKNIFI